MANYSVDIEVALQGANKLKQFSSEVDKTLKVVNQLNAALEKTKAINPYNAAGARQVTELDKQRLRLAQERLRAEREFLQVTERENQVARQKSAEYLRQLRLQKELIKGAQASSIELGPGGPAFSGGYSRMGRRMANFAAAPPSFINKQVAGRLGGAASNAIIGGAFPLLFGQGAGAAAGGAIGGGLGGLLGGQFGFGLSLVGTLIGDIASKGQKIKELGQDIGFSSQQTQQLGNAFKVANTDVEKFTAVIQNVRGVGLEVEDQAKAIQLITTLTDKYGGSFEKVGNTITSVLESGKVSQANLNQLSSQGIDIQGALASKYKTSRDNILKMAKDGTISVQSLIDTLVDMGNKGTDAADKPKSAMDNLQDSVNKLGDAVKNLASKFVTAFGPVFKWLTDRVTEFINAVSRAISRLADLMAGGRMTQATLQAETAAQQATTKKFGVIGGIRAFNPAAEAFFQQQKELRLRQIVPGAFAPNTKTPPLETFRAPAQAAPGGADSRDRAAERAAKAAAKEAARVDEVVRGRMAEAEIINLQSTIQDRIAKAEAARDPMLVARLEGQQKLLELQYRYAEQLANETDIRAQQAIIFEGQNALTAAQRDTQRELAEIARTEDQRRMDDMKKYIEQQYELNTAVQQQKDLAESISGTLNQGLVSTFDLLIQGSQNWQASLQQIASGVLIEIANQLLRIFVIEQAINTLRTFLTPFSSATPLGAGGGTVGRYGTLGPNYGIRQRANGGPVLSGQPYLVGEQGPELFMPRSSGSIYPNDAIGAGSVQVGSVNITVQNTGEQLSPAAQKQIANQVQGIVMATLVNQKRSGGIL